MFKESFSFPQVASPGGGLGEEGRWTLVPYNLPFPKVIFQNETNVQVKTVIVRPM